MVLVSLPLLVHGRAEQNQLAIDNETVLEIEPITFGLRDQNLNTWPPDLVVLFTFIFVVFFGLHSVVNSHQLKGC